MTSQLQVLLILIITTTRVLVKNVFSFFLALIFGGFYTICVSFTFDSIRKRKIYIIIGLIEIVYFFIGNLVIAINALNDNPDICL